MPTARLSKELTTLMLNLTSEFVPIPDTRSTMGPNSILHVFQKYAQKDSVKTHHYFASIWRSLIDTAADNLTNRIHYLESEIGRISDVTTLLMNKIKNSPNGTPSCRTLTHMTRCIDYMGRVTTHKTHIDSLRKILTQLTETRTVSSLKGTGRSAKSGIHYYLQRSSNSLAQQSHHFIPEVPSSTDSLDDRKFFYSDSVKMSWTTPGLLAKTSKEKTMWTTEKRHCDVHVFFPTCWTDVKRDYGINRGKVAALLITMDNLLSLGITSSRYFANGIDTKLREIIQPSPAVNALTYVVPAEGLKTADDEVMMDPVLYTPFVAGNTVYKMHCCNNYLAKETIDGIIRSGRTPKCPMCRGPLLITREDDTTNEAEVFDLGLDSDSESYSDIDLGLDSDDDADADSIGF